VTGVWLLLGLIFLGALLLVAYLQEKDH